MRASSATKPSFALIGIVCTAWVSACSGTEGGPLDLNAGAPTAPTNGGSGFGGSVSSSGGVNSSAGTTCCSTSGGVQSGVGGLAGGASSGGVPGGGGAAGGNPAAGGSLTGMGGAPTAFGGRSSGGTAGQNTAGQNTAGQNTAGQNTAGQNTAGQNTAGQQNTPEGGRGGASGAGGSTASGGMGPGNGTGPGGVTCPYHGNVTYTLAKSANPTAAEQDAYARISAALDKAIQYYNCYTDITKKLNVSYVPSVQTADGNINGSMRFGSNTTYMDYRTAMHEIGHTVGIGQASNWASFVSADKLFTGENANAELRAINASLATPSGDGKVHADNQHFWPYGINQQNEVKSEADLLFHCRMIMAIRKDLGLK